MKHDDFLLPEKYYKRNSHEAENPFEYQDITVLNQLHQSYFHMQQAALEISYFSYISMLISHIYIYISYVIKSDKIKQAL